MSDKLNPIQLYIVSAEQDLYSGAVSRVFVSGVSGDIEVTPGHIPLLTLLRPGQVKFWSSQNENDYHEESIYVSGGILEIQPTEVTVLADTALRVDELDEQRLERAEAEVREKLTGAQGIEYSEALTELTEVMAQWRLLKERKNRH